MRGGIRREMPLKAPSLLKGYGEGDQPNVPVGRTVADVSVKSRRGQMGGKSPRKPKSTETKAQEERSPKIVGHIKRSRL